MTNPRYRQIDEVQHDRLYRWLGLVVLPGPLVVVTQTVLNPIEDLVYELVYRPIRQRVDRETE